VQQGSTPQIGVDAGDVDPAGNQQQQPLQSIHAVSCVSGWHTHDEASPPLLPLEELVAPPLLLLLLPLPLEELVEPPLLLPDDPPPEDPPSSPEEPPVPLVLLQAASPTVDDVPMTTMTWKSFSMFMKHTIPPIGPTETCPDWHSRVAPAARSPMDG
jgi:hypothetical protein